MKRLAYNTCSPDQRDSTLGQLFVSIIVPPTTIFDCLVGDKITLTVLQVMMMLTFCSKDTQWENSMLSSNQSCSGRFLTICR